MDTMSVFEQMVEIFKDADTTSANHKRGIVLLKKIFTETDPNTSADALRKCVLAYLEPDYRVDNPHAARILQFITDACKTMQQIQTTIDSDIDAPFVTVLLNFLVAMTFATDDNIRCRACYFLSKVCNGLIGQDLATKMCDNIHDALMDATQDKLHQIRSQAVMALAPFQQKGAHCPVAEAIAELMENDPSPIVRQVCVESIALKQCFMGEIVKCSLDVSVNVRKAIYKRAIKFPQNFKIAHKQALIFNALHGTVDHLGVIEKFVCEELCPEWLQYCELNYIRFLKLFRTDWDWDELLLTEEVQEALLRFLFKTRQTKEILSVLELDAFHVIKLEDLNFDTALFWRVLITDLMKTETLENVPHTPPVIPQIPAFRSLVEQYCIHMCAKIKNNAKGRHVYLEFQYVLLQLFKMIASFNYTDVACKQHIIELAEYVLNTCTLDWETLLQIMQVLELVMPSHTARIEFVCALAISGLTDSTEVTEPIQTPVVSEPRRSCPPSDDLDTTQQQFDIAQLKLKVFTLSDELHQAVQSQNFIKASELKEQLEEAQNKLNEKQAASKAQNVVNPLAILAEEEDEEEEEEESINHMNVKKITNSTEIVHWLNVVSALLYDGRITTMDAILHSFKMNFLEDYIQDESLTIQVAAMRCLSFYCLLNAEIAKMTIPVFATAIVMHNRATQDPAKEYMDLISICIRLVVDSLIKYGPTAMFDITSANLSNPDIDEDAAVFTSGVTLPQLVAGLLALLNDENTKIQELAARGFCNLLLRRVMRSHVIITPLILKYFTINTIDGINEIKLQQYIGLTLSRLPNMPEVAKAFEKSVLEPIKQVLTSPKNGSLANVDIDNMTKLLIHMCSEFADSDTIFYNLSLQIIRAIRRKPNNLHNTHYSKMLTMMRFTEKNKEYLSNLLLVIDDVRNVLNDKKTLEYITKFNTNLTFLLEGNEVEVAENEDSEEESEGTNIPKYADFN